MAEKGNHNRHVVWQDIVPVPKRPTTATKKRRSITITLPSLSKLKFFKKLTIKITKIPRRRRFLTASLASVLIIGTGAYYILILHPASVAKSAQTNAQSITLVKGTPTYATILPAGKSSQSLGGWTRVSPPTSNAVFAYSDTIGSSAINVSEQPLPTDFKTNPNGQVGALAQSFNATEKITVGSVIAYIANGDEGSQRVFFSKNNLLILVSANARVSDDDWAKYINSMQ